MTKPVPYLGRHCQIVSLFPASFGPSDCPGELKFLEIVLDRGEDGQPNRLVEMWGCPCGAMLAIAEGELVDVYRRPRSPAELVKDLAASFELPPGDR